MEKIELMLHNWRPSHRCIYIVPEILGDMRSLEVIINRILPLRKFKNQEDTIVFLGNYINGDGKNDKVIDCLINIKNEYKDRAIFLRGTNEELLLRARNSNNDFSYWIDNGGLSTIESYIKRAGINSSPNQISKSRLHDLIPINHMEFFSSLEYYRVIDDYCFFHGGFDPGKSILENNINNFVFDFTSSKYVKECLKNKKEPTLKDNYVFISHHNYLGKKPLIYQKYFMLGGLAPAKLLVFELNSMSACAVSRGKSRIYKYNFDYCD